MIINRKGDLLKQTDIDILGHQTNCKGVWGSGLAYQIKKVFPECFPAYKEYCKQHNSKALGSVLFTKTNSGKFIANIFGQDNYGTFTRQTDYTALRNGLEHVHDYCLKNNLTIGLPAKIGCDRGGGDWNIVLGFITEIFGESPVCCVIVEYVK